MARGTRAVSTPDVQRMGQAFARPGMDTRTWVMTAVVRQFVVDPEHGVFVEVALEPSGDIETAMVGAAYAGNGFGFYAPIEVGDVVGVMTPNGDPDAGLIVVARLWNADDKPPSAAGTMSTPSPDVHLVIKPGKKLRINVSGDGEVVFNNGTLKVARVTDPVNVGYLSGANGGGPVVFVFTPQNADGTVPLPGPTAVPISAIISNSGGAPKVKM